MNRKEIDLLLARIEGLKSFLEKNSLEDFQKEILRVDNYLKRFGSLDERLSKPRSWDFVVIDSFQYTQMSYKEYIAFKERHRNKLLIFVSHADGKRPDGRAASKVMYDASLKIWVEGYKAFSKGRFIGPTGECTIYEEGARKYWG